LEFWKLAIDNLHNLKGVIKMLLIFERLRKDWSEDLFLVNLCKHLQRQSTSKMKGALWRLLLVCHESVILPSVQNMERREQLRTTFDYLTEIQCIAYAEPRIQKIKQVRLRLHVLCFLLGLKLKETHSSLQGEGMLYLHTVLTLS